MTTTDPIDVAVDAEVRRRKKNVRIFLGLLILPVLVAVAAVVFYTPTAAQVQDVRPIVREEMQRTIEPQVATQVTRQLDARVAPIQGQYHELSNKVEKFDVRVYGRSDPAVRNRIDELTRKVQTLEAQVALLQRRLDAMNGSTRLPLREVPHPR